jgi:hypothetical protein
MFGVMERSRRCHCQNLNPNLTLRCKFPSEVVTRDRTVDNRHVLVAVHSAQLRKLQYLDVNREGRIGKWPLIRDLNH